MADYKFVGELHFAADDMNDALAKLGEHFSKLARGEVSDLLNVGSNSALGEPEFDSSLNALKLVDCSTQKVVAHG